MYNFENWFRIELRCSQNNPCKKWLIIDFFFMILNRDFAVFGIIMVIIKHKHKTNRAQRGNYDPVTLLINNHGSVVYKKYLLTPCDLRFVDRRLPPPCQPPNPL